MILGCFARIVRARIDAVRIYDAVSRDHLRCARIRLKQVEVIFR